MDTAGKVYSGATSTLADISGTLAITKGGTGLTSITGNRLLYSNADGTALLEVATSSLNIGGTAANVTGTVAISTGGTGLTSITGNRLLYSNADGTALVQVATSSLNIGGNAATVTNGIYTTDTGTVTNTMLAGSIAASKLSLTKGNFIVGNDAGTAQATSTIFISSTGNLGVGSTSPWAALSVHSLFGNPNQMLFAVASSSLTATTTLFSIDRTGLTTIGDSSGTGNANFQFAADANAWSVGYNATDKSFNIASSTNFSSGQALTITKGSILLGIASSSPWRTLSVNGTVAFNGLSANATTTTSSNLCIDNVTKEVTASSVFVGCIGSSERFKHDIQSLTVSSLDIVKGLEPKSFIYNGDPTNTTTWGFIAEQANELDPHLVATRDGTIYNIVDRAFLAVAVGAIKELNLNIETIASTTASSTPASRSFADNFFGGIFSKLTEWFADAANGVGQFFAREVHTDSLCVKKSDGTDVCVTGDQLAALLAGQNAAPAATEPISEPTPEPVPTQEPVVEPPPDSTQASSPQAEPAPTSEPVTETVTEPIVEPVPVLDSTDSTNSLQASSPQAESAPTSEPAPEPAA